MFFHPNFKPTILAIHGSASTSGQWRHLACELGGAAHVIAPDLPGYGSAAHDRGSRLAMLKRAASASCTRLHLIGHSFGGLVALKLANAMPERVASVTLYDPIFASEAHGLAPELASLWHRFGSDDDAVFMQAFLDFWAGCHTWAALDPRQQSRLVAHAPGLRRDMGEVDRGMWSLDRAAYHGPLTILFGASSPDAVRHMACAIAARHPQTLIERVDGVGHLAPLTEPNIINQRLCHALKRHGVNLDPQQSGIHPAAA